MTWKWYKIECPVCHKETDYYWMQWKFYVDLRKDGIPCDAPHPDLKHRCAGRIFPPEPEKFE